MIIGITQVVLSILSILAWINDVTPRISGNVSKPKVY